MQWDESVMNVRKFRRHLSSILDTAPVSSDEGNDQKCWQWASYDGYFALQELSSWHGQTQLENVPKSDDGGISKQTSLASKVKVWIPPSLGEYGPVTGSGWDTLSKSSLQIQACLANLVIRWEFVLIKDGESENSSRNNDLEE